MTEAIEAISALNRHVLKLLVRLREVLDEIIDIMEVELDEELQARIEEGLEDMREGRLRRLEDFLRELEEGKLTGPEAVRERPSRLVLISEHPVVDMREVRPPEGTVLVHAQSEPFNELGLVELETLKAWLRQFGIPTLYAHSSGHASLMRLARLVEQAQPDLLVVVHTPEPELCRKFFARFCQRVVVPGKGERICI